jgi:hypothetical protein
LTRPEKNVRFKFVQCIDECGRAGIIVDARDVYQATAHIPRDGTDANDTKECGEAGRSVLLHTTGIRSLFRLEKTIEVFTFSIFFRR